MPELYGYRRKWVPIDNGDHFLIPLTRGEFALINKEDMDKIKAYSWSLWDKKGSKYAVSCIKEKTTRMHNLLVPYKMVDHKNRNGLDNRKENLRPCNKSENAYNSKKRSNNQSGYTGVCKVNNRWRSQFCKNYEKFHMGYFDTPEKAYEAYCKYSESIIGIFKPKV